MYYLVFVLVSIGLLMFVLRFLLFFYTVSQNYRHLASNTLNSVFSSWISTNIVHCTLLELLTITRIMAFAPYHVC